MTETNSAAPTSTSAPGDEAPLWVVAVGASAGGLEALRQFFGQISAPTRAAFVVVQHLSPDHRSMMSELLGRGTTLPVHEAQAGEPLRADRVFVMPPGVLMTLEQGQLAFSPRPEHGVSLPIDAFLQSLSGPLADRCIAVILSGSGSDGAQGCAALRAAGGYVMVQTPETAKFDGMPRSALAATSADSVQTPEALAGAVLALTRGDMVRLGSEGLVDQPAIKPAMQRLFELLLGHAGVDFSQYKLPTMLRRIERRMNVLGSASISDYVERVSARPDECELLRRELLIPVTRFFRDPDVFEALGLALRQRLMQAGADQPLRIWCAGCATGEEAYSVAITALEACAAAQRWPGVKVFASDIDSRFLSTAAAGVYPAVAADAIERERLSRYFDERDGQLAVRPEVRQLVLFARHNLLDDVPFTKMDLVVCRNTLIYFQFDAQERVMRRLQYALNPDGLLLLGSSESLGVLQADFQVVDAAAKLFRLVRPVLAIGALAQGLGPMGAGSARAAATAPGTAGPRGSTPRSGLVERATSQLLQAYVPVSLLITPQRQLLHAWGPTERWLRMPSGQPNLDVIRMLPPRLGALVGHLLQRAARDPGPCTAAPLEVTLDGRAVLVRVVARAVTEAAHAGTAMPSDATGSVVVTLEEQLPAPAAADAASLGADTAALDRIATLERELAESRLTLQTSIEELGAANEELQAANEELMSANEELQSTNEELQSVNEELHTVNAEYNAKLEQVAALHADLEGMSRATGIATLFVDNSLALVRFTPEAALLFRLRAEDVGRAITDFNCQLSYPQLADDLRTVLDGAPTVEREVQGPNAQRHLARVLGYADVSGRRRRAVLSLVDVTRLHDLDRLQRVMDALSQHIAVIDGNGTIVMVNAAWGRFAQVNRASDRLAPDSGLAANYLGVVARSSTPCASQLLSSLQELLAQRRSEVRMVYPCHSPTERRWYMMQALPLRPERDGRLAGAVISHTDITAWVGLHGPDLGRLAEQGLIAEGEALA